jgi:hypothetical protein
MLFLHWILFPLLNVSFGVAERSVVRIMHYPPGTPFQMVFKLEDLAVAGILIRNTILSLLWFAIQSAVRLQEIINGRNLSVASITATSEEERQIVIKLPIMLGALLALMALYFAYFLLLYRYDWNLPQRWVLLTNGVAVVCMSIVPYLFFS